MPLLLLVVLAAGGCASGRGESNRLSASRPGFPVWSGASLGADLSTLNRIGRDRPAGTQAHRLAHLYLTGRMREIGLQPAQPGYVQPWGIRPDTSLNLLGLLGGAHPTLRDSAVVLLAPFDAGVNGRNVATAAALELVRSLDETSRFYRYPTRTVVLALVDGEEGVRAYLRNPAWPLSATRAVVRLGGQAMVRPQRLPASAEWYALAPNPGLPADSSARALADEVHALLLPFLAAE
jgi:hypothetical protein